GHGPRVRICVFAVCRETKSEEIRKYAEDAILKKLFQHVLLRICVSDYSSKKSGRNFFRPIPFTEDGVRLRTIFFYVKMTIRALFSPKSSFFLCRCTDAHTK
ncbi:MAG: hypothetical protein ACKOB3_00545, partial [Holophagaceae bacterium]